MNREAKIVATIGPASSSEDVLSSLMDAGVNVVRLNFSHGTRAGHLSVIQLIRKLAEQKGKAIAVLQDLQGPKVRIGEIPGGEMFLASGESLDVYFAEDLESVQPTAGASVKWIYIPIPSLLPQLHTGMKILLDDGKIEFALTNIYPDHASVEVILGGRLTSHKGFNLPGTCLDIPGFTEKDREDLHFGITNGVDYVAVSFVRTPADIDIVREDIAAFSQGRVVIPIIAKLERPEALENLEGIIKVADGVMVARGDLGIELSPEFVPVAQKRIIRAANLAAKPVITATQMLESMISNPRPTRAEAADVANAIFDGSDAVMLSGETAIGNFPIDSVRVMDAIIREAEAHYADWSLCAHEPEMDTTDDAVAVTRAARELARDRNVKTIAVFTHSGRTALLMSKTKTTVPVLAFTPLQTTYQRMSLYRGVTAYLVPFASSTEMMIETVDQVISKLFPEIIDQQVVLISGFPANKMRSPNFALLHTVGEL